jgi:hypothetical protein
MAKNTENKDSDAFLHETSSQHILLEEYRMLQGRFTNLRDEGMTRMNFFITSVSVAIGGVLIFGSGNNNLSVEYFKFILLGTIALLTVVGCGIFDFLVSRDIAADRCERGLARIRYYFVRLDPVIENYFVTAVANNPTRYLTRKYSNTRRTAQTVVAFLLGLAFLIISTFIDIRPELDILIGFVMAIIVFIALEAYARKKIIKAFRIVEKETQFFSDSVTTR